MSPKSNLTTLTTLVAALGTTAALAAGPMSSTDMRTDQFPYLNGGIGQTSQETMKQASNDYSLGLSFARSDGAFIDNVDLKILDANGQTVLEREHQHPMVLVDLPAGRYTVVSTYEGRTQRYAVEVPQKGHRQVVLNW